MCAQKIKKRKIPLSAGWAAVLSLISFSFITGGVFIAYPAVRDLISGRSGPIGSMICIAGSLVPFVLGWLTLRASRQGIGDRIAFEDASATTIARINDRGRAQRKDSYGRTFYTYWVTFQFQPSKSKRPARDLVLKADVRMRLHDSLETGRSVRVRYGISNPQFTLLEGESRNFERVLDFNHLLLHWALLNLLGGMMGSYFGSSFGGGDPLLIGLIIGLVLGIAQWTVLLRYIPMPNWIWVSTSMIGWAVFAGLGNIAYGLVGGIVLGIIQWLILRRKVTGAELWVLLSVVGAVAGQIAFMLIAPSTHYLLASAIFEIAYAIPTGIALYLIASRQKEGVSPDQPFGLPPSDIQPLVGKEDPQMPIPDDVAKEMKLVLNGKLISDNADDSIIKHAIEDLSKDGVGFAILSRTDDTYIQVLVENYVDFRLEHQDGSLDEHYLCVVPDLDLAQVIRAFDMFLKSDARLESEFSWELMAL